MDKWTIIFTVISDVIFSGIIVLCCNSIISKKFADKQKREENIYSVMNNLISIIHEIKTSIVRIHSNMGDNDENIKNYIMRGGDLQIYVEDFNAYLKKYEEEFNFEKLDELVKKIYQSCLYMQKSSEDSEYIVKFGAEVNNVLDMCTDLIQTYNKYIYDVRK